MLRSTTRPSNSVSSYRTSFKGMCDSLLKFSNGISLFHDYSFIESMDEIGNLHVYIRDEFPPGLYDILGGSANCLCVECKSTCSCDHMGKTTKVI